MLRADAFLCVVRYWVGLNIILESNLMSKRKGCLCCPGCMSWILAWNIHKEGCWLVVFCGSPIQLLFPKKCGREAPSRSD